MSDDERGFREVDRWAGGVGWLPEPAERLQRTGHALAVDGDVWLVDPVDCPGIDDLLAEFGEVAGVYVGLDRHKRDAATVARRHGVSVHIARPLGGIAADLDAPVKLVDAELADTGYRAVAVVDNPLWSEVALHDPDSGTLLVPEAVGTVPFFRAPGERLGVHPVLRLWPPRRALSGLDPDRVLVGHGEGIQEDAAGALDAALHGARRGAPSLYVKMLRSMLGR